MWEFFHLDTVVDVIIYLAGGSGMSLVRKEAVRFCSVWVFGSVRCLSNTLVKSRVFCTYSSGLRRSMWLRSRGVGERSPEVITKAARIKEPAQRGCREWRVPRDGTCRAGERGGWPESSVTSSRGATEAGGREHLEKWGWAVGMRT